MFWKWARDTFLENCELVLGSHMAVFNGRVNRTSIVIILTKSPQWLSLYSPHPVNGRSKVQLQLPILLLSLSFTWWTRELCHLRNCKNGNLWVKAHKEANMYLSSSAFKPHNDHLGWANGTAQETRLDCPVWHNHKAVGALKNTNYAPYIWG